MWEGKEAADMKERVTGEEAWWNNVRWEVNELKKEGYIRTHAERYLWELSERGIDLAEDCIENPIPVLNDF